MILLAWDGRGNRWHSKTKKGWQVPSQTEDIKLGEGCEFTQGQRMEAKLATGRPERGRTTDPGGSQRDSSHLKEYSLQTF